MNNRLTPLIEKHLTGELTPSEEKELRKLLRASSENRDLFCAHGLIEGRIRWEMGSQIENTTLPRRQTAQRPPAIKKWIPMAALLVLALILGFIMRAPLGDFKSSQHSTLQNGKEAAPLPEADLPPRTVARLTSEKEAHWEFQGSERSLSSGFWLAPGKWSITQGAATITLDSGAKITLLAPAKVELISSNHARLIKGKVSVDVPEPAIGFTLDTPSGRIVDLSTRFNVSVEQGEHEEVQVLEGEVIVHYGDKHQLSKLISKKSAVQIHTEGALSELTPAPFLPSSYPQEVEFTPNEQPSNHGVGYIHWSFDKLKKTHPHQTFPAGGTLEGAHNSFAKVITPGSTHAQETIQGVFNQALHLNGDGTCLQTNFPGIAGSQARTIAFWVRIPPHAQDKEAYSIIGWGFSDPHHGPQKWEIGWNTSRFPTRGTGVKGAIRTDFGLGHTIGTTNLRDGRWHHVVSVFTGGQHADAATHIRHYVDGKLESVSAYRQQAIDTAVNTKKALPAVIGKYLHARDQSFGTFHGSIDELYVFNAALTPAQILQLHRTNTPPKSEDLLPSPTH